jgi:hypothetical protein
MCGPVLPPMSWNLKLKHLWATCKNCDSLAAFLQCIHTVEELDIITWQRTFTVDTWERTCCDFLWACCQHKQGCEEWTPSMHQLWPSVRQIIAERNMEEAFSSLVL